MSDDLSDGAAAVLATLEDGDGEKVTARILADDGECFITAAARDGAIDCAMTAAEIELALFELTEAGYVVCHGEHGSTDWWSLA